MKREAVIQPPFMFESFLGSHLQGSNNASNIQYVVELANQFGDKSRDFLVKPK